MCKPDGLRETRRVIVAGAGPAGLLMASLLLARNEEAGPFTYHVTLVDGREDYGNYSQEELSKNHRSWMLGLADHGMDAIKTLPDLYNNYVKGQGILTTEGNIYLGKKKISFPMDSSSGSDSNSSPPEAFIVDRNYVVAALARYAKETHGDDDNFTPMYLSKCQYVDYENKQVLVRSNESQKEKYIPYDLLIGCDGVRSTVREALIKRHSNFTCETTDIFQEFKATHLELPKSVSASALSLLPDIFPYCQGIVLPETGGQANISIGVPRNCYEKLAEELKSSDYKVVAEYTKKNFKAFELQDYDDFAKQWVGQRWNQTGMVHCNFYHSVQTGIVIMGDAAHATSPSIGMGMNTALRDAQMFDEILKESKDDLTTALPAFSEARVKEGNALSDLAYYLYCADKTQQTIETLHMIVRGTLHSKFPRLVDQHPQSLIGRRGVALSDVYDLAVKQGIIRKHRAINDKIRMQHFEQSTGMVKSAEKESGSVSKIITIGSVLVAFAAYKFLQV